MPKADRWQEKWCAHVRHFLLLYQDKTRAEDIRGQEYYNTMTKKALPGHSGEHTIQYLGITAVGVSEAPSGLFDNGQQRRTKNE